VAVLNQQQVNAQNQETKKMMPAKVLNDSESKMMECMMVAKPITINKVHCMCRHMRQVEMHEICEQYSQEITKWGFKQCQHCGKAKVKQLAVAINNQEHIVVLKVTECSSILAVSSMGQRRRNFCQNHIG
jgi:ABC-type uncharacterized transport system ATPase component